ncbi:DIBOA-glucoside dioxygenase BX6-like [Miscanthus floridulus]|uniref:DIBOA-glucoside dioxygenase BX6-like n=1 Tax=Miscanthus floridulus TaxID=154761 RepID=UPI00345A37CB
MSTTEEAAGGYSYDRLSELKAFDDTKAGDKGLLDAGVTTVPAIFCHHQDGPQVSPSSSSGSTISVIPVIDLSAADTTARAEVVAQVKAAAETVGFFQLVNHGTGEGSARLKSRVKLRRTGSVFPSA